MQLVLLRTKTADIQAAQPTSANRMTRRSHRSARCRVLQPLGVAFYLIGYYSIGFGACVLLNGFSGALKALFNS